MKELKTMGQCSMKEKQPEQMYGKYNSLSLTRNICTCTSQVTDVKHLFLPQIHLGGMCFDVVL